MSIKALELEIDILFNTFTNLMLKLILNLTKKASSHMQPEKKHLFYDIAANLTDSQFSG